MIKKIMKILKVFFSGGYTIYQVIGFLIFLSVTISLDVLWMRIVFGILTILPFLFSLILAFLIGKGAGLKEALDKDVQ